MISLLTGLPGHGKGVYGLDWLITKINKENEDLIAKGKEPRVVYYSGINDCKIPNWVELEDPTKWYECPIGSFILIDECQRIFRTRANGAAVPKYVSELETHRHRGLDLLLITQHPMLIDQNIRRLVGQHFHIIRKFGMQKAVVHEFNSVVEQPQKSRKGSIKHEYSYNKKIYELYKSAEVHTVKRNIPMRYYFMFIMPVAALGLMYFGYTKISASAFSDRVKDNSNLSIPNADGKILPATTKADIDSLNYIQARTPEVKDLPFTAPVYQELTKPTTAPYPAACVKSASKGCSCWSQQGTRLDTSKELCMQIVEKGFFIDWQDKTAQENQSSKPMGGIGGSSTPHDDGLSVPPSTIGLTSRSSPNNSPNT